ncbi:GNAT family N-acetyltransferase [Metabacillus bambusae]|uniref:GNAT family N-acetyltransferase n=1 Tax=Metabacillus bambusae TaxID=2795218 RepID=A0ABS3MYW9_9BACI|nr:GNAT family N-acetyltransferase [Metabacillus bambusae]MBO1511031.1 GNAT family N-acetyltransferase [Metabacillus bambusae]
MITRNIKEEDYYKVINVLNDWWGGRQMTHLLPRLFFEHFQPTSFIVEDENEVLSAFLIGFVSQTHLNEAYIHFVGVNPKDRKNGLARELYELFFTKVIGLGCNTVRCITSPVNEGSISFHISMGFSVSLSTDYAGLGQDCILFSKSITTY